MTRAEQITLALFHQLLPEAEVRRAPSPAADIEIVIRGQRLIQLRPKWAGAGYPRDIVQALRGFDGDPGTVLVAEQMSPGALDMLEARGINWISADGAARLRVGPIVIERDPRKQRSNEVRTRASQWTATALEVGEQVLAEYLLRREPTLASVREVAAHTGRSLAATSVALRTFEDHGWVSSNVRRGRLASRELVDPGAMLDAWAPAAEAVIEADGFSLVWGELQSAVEAVHTELGNDMAVGGRLGAAVVAPHATVAARARVYVSGALTVPEMEKRLLRVGLVRDESASAPVQVVRAARSVLRAASQHGSIRVASPVRLFADLLGLGDRGGDEAAFLREVAIGF